MRNETGFPEATPPQIVALQRGLMEMGARPHHVMPDGSVVSDEGYDIVANIGLMSRHHYDVGAVVRVVNLSPGKIIRARHAHDDWVEDLVVGDHFPSGKPEVPVYWEAVSDRP